MSEPLLYDPFTFIIFCSVHPPYTVMLGIGLQCVTLDRRGTIPPRALGKEQET